jgi:hypothetical protein
LAANANTYESYINLYESRRQAYDSNNNRYVTSSDGSVYKSDYGFQNLLTVGFISDAYNLPDGTLTVSKTVTGLPSSMESPDFTFEAEFKQGGKAYTGEISVLPTRLNAKTAETEKWTPDEKGKKTFTLKSGENVKITLPAGVTYTVKEINIPTNFTQTSPEITTTNPTGSVTGAIETAANQTAAFTNKYDVPQTDGTLTVSKAVVRASNGAAVTSTSTDMPDVDFTFEAAFTKDKAAYTDVVSYEKDGSSSSWTPDTNGKVTFKLKNGESVKITLPAGVTYTVTEPTDSMPTDFALNTTTGDSTGTIAGGTDATVTFTNTFTDTVNLQGTKTWENDTESGRPSEITLELWKRVNGVESKISSSDTGWSGWSGSFKTSASSNWTYTFSNKPKYENGYLITYFVKEPDPPTGYTATVDGMNVTNTKAAPETVSLTLKKLVAGKFADMNKAFAFTIMLKDDKGNNVSGSFDVETSNGVTSGSISDGKITFTNGTAAVDLANEQQIKIKELPKGYTYEIQEALDGNELYRKSISVNDTALAVQSEGNTGARTINSDETVTYTNTSQDIVPTGMNTNLAPYVILLTLMILLAGFTCAFGLMRRKYRRLH